MKIFYKDKVYTEFIIKDNIFYISNDIDIIKIKDVIYFEIECSKCFSKSKIKKIAKNTHIDKEFLCRSCRTSGENNAMYGYKYTEEQKLKMSERNKGKNNPFYGKKHTENTKNKIGIKNSENMKGEKNPMYNKKFFDIWVEKYGLEKAKLLLEEKSNNHSENMRGENNPFYGKKHTEETCKKISENLKNSEKVKKITQSKEYREKMSNILKGRIFSSEHKKNLRLSAIKQINKKLENGYQITPNFNIEACKLFDDISEKNNIHIQHAMNGGEFYIKELGYWVDGYDKENNIVYEYDEPEHFDFNGNLKEKDINRQKEIEECLKCKFVRIKK